MHGLIANQLRSYTLSRHGRETWSEGRDADSDAALPDGPVPLDRSLPRRAGGGDHRGAGARDGDGGAGTPRGLRRLPGRRVAPRLPAADVREWRTLDVIEHARSRSIRPCASAIPPRARHTCPPLADRRPRWRWSTPRLATCVRWPRDRARVEHALRRGGARRPARVHAARRRAVPHPGGSAAVLAGRSGRAPAADVGARLRSAGRARGLAETLGDGASRVVGTVPST